MSGTLYFSPNSRFFIAAEDVPAALHALQTLTPSSRPGHSDVNNVLEAVNKVAGSEPRQALESIFAEFAWGWSLTALAPLLMCISIAGAYKTM